MEDYEWASGNGDLDGVKSLMYHLRKSIVKPSVKSFVGRLTWQLLSIIRYHFFNYDGEIQLHDLAYQDLAF